MKITVEWLKEHGACQEGIEWFERNKLYLYNGDINDIIGDYEGYISWIKFALKCKYEYDDRGRMIKKIYPDGRIIKYEYDSHGRTIKEITPYGNIYSYDSHENLINKITPYGIYSYEYDDRGRMIKEITPFGKIYGYEYDKNGMLIEIIENNKSILKIK